MAFTSWRKSLFLFLSALVVFLGLILVYNDRGLMHLSRLCEEKEKLMWANEDLREENRRLVLKIQRIKKDPHYIEEEARKKLGLVRPDETIFRLKEEL